MKLKLPGVFDLIAPVYDLFYNYQKKNFNRMLVQLYEKENIGKLTKVVDLGCGTGALCSVLNQRGHEVTGVDASRKMLEKAVKKPENRNIRFFLANAHEPLPFEDNSFDLAVTSFVAHGLKPEDRMALYREMKRLARELVIIYDYNDRRSLLISIAEWAEHGDYFNFIKVAEREMKEVFSEVHILPASEGSSWYICKP